MCNFLFFDQNDVQIAHCTPLIRTLPPLILELEHQGGQENPAIYIQEITWMGPRQPAASAQSFYLTSA